jgi:hypothetical protein
MALIDSDLLEPHEPVRVYIAGRLREAKTVEQVLTAAGLDYAVEIERYERRLLGLIRREYDGVAFHVAAADAERARQVLSANRLTAGLEDEAP